MIRRMLPIFSDAGIVEAWRPLSCPKSFEHKYVRRISKKYDGQDRAIVAFSKKSVTPIKFQHMCNMMTDGKPNHVKLKLAALFLKKELPIRLAKMLGDLESLPYGLSQTSSIASLREIYVSTFNQIVNYPTKDIEQDYTPFVDLLKVILRNHRYVVPMTAMGLVEMKRGNPTISDLSTSCPFLGQFLTKFFLSRIALRLLTAHLICCVEGWKDYSAEIHHNCDFDEICEAIAADVTNICNHNYGRAPVIEVRSRLKKKFTYLPGHIHVILFELLKNSCRAVCEFHKDSINLPPIQVIVVGGGNEVSIKIQDEGGGIPLDDINKIWLYTYSSARISEDTWDDKKLVNALKGSLVFYKLPGKLETTLGESEGVPDEHEDERVDLFGGIVDAPMAGFGYGLPIARVYATFFGGSMDLKSVHRHGTDTYVFLPFIKPDTLLPV